MFTRSGFTESWRCGPGSSGGLVLLAALVAAACATPAARAEEKIVFNRDVRPILSENCFACHGPDKNKRKADLRLDIRDQAIKHEAIVAGQPDDSDLVLRINSDDPDETMPPPKSRKTLTAKEKDILRRWVAEGALYQGHWAYEAPVKLATKGNAIDDLVVRKLAGLGANLSPEADRRTLARRLYFDLLGLPPTPNEVEVFVNDASPGAYERLVETLLASPHYGERMSIPWLDVVRFADTIGYHSDNPRNVWPYRDYVISAFNRNMPFDRFTVEQLAGDLLPNATQEQKIASCFNRLLLTTEEGGAQPKDYVARMMADRVRAVGAVWLGQTLGCCQCHDHKFDPFQMRDFYSLGAFFADIQEPVIGAREPGMLVSDEAQAKELARLREALAVAIRREEGPSRELAAGQTAWEKAVLAELAAAVRNPVQAGRVAAPPKEIVEVLRIDPAKRDAAQRDRLTVFYRQNAPERGEARAGVKAAREALAAYEAGIPRCLISTSMSTPNTVRILPRGNWLDESGEVVSPAFPRSLARSNGPEGRRLTRLDLARWIASRDNPLTARVYMNRLWKQFFGVGLSRTLDDLGSQGEWPVHPELLDWLACDFMDSGWDVKRMVRTIVGSRTYRQVSTASREWLTRDPANRLLARQSRFRLDAEFIRDDALAVSGLLVSRVGGPSVKPYQPDGYWENLNFPQRQYKADQGANEYRRGLYSWWQRSFLHPSLLAFDAPSREECVAERNRSNIPQQALVLLNDPTYVEAARVFAARILKEGGVDQRARIAWAWREALQRPPRKDELDVIAALLDKNRTHYAQDQQAALALLKDGLAPVPSDVDPRELAAWTNVARVILNLHETITRN